MFFIENGQVYEKTIVVTETQTAEVITHKCSQFKVILKLEDSKIKIEYLDWENNHIDSNLSLVLRHINHTTGNMIKSKENLINGYFEYLITTLGEQSVSITVEGTDGANLFFEIL